MLRIATTPALWSNDDDHTLGANTSVETALTAIAELGIEGVEDGHKLPTEPGALKATLDQHGLTFAAGFHGTHLLDRSAEDEIEALAPVIVRLQEVGCKTLVLREVSNAISDADTPMSRKPTLDDAAWDSFGLKLEQVAKHLAEHDIVASYQPYAGTVIHTPEEIDRLMTETGTNLFLCFDSAQIYVGGGDPGQVLTRHLPRVRHVHLGDVRVRPLTKSRMGDTGWPEAVRAGIFGLPGDKDGSVDFKTLLNLLTASEYEGFVTLTAGIDPERTNPKEALTQAMKTLANLAQNGTVAA
ncbi:Inosose dehydratase [Rhodobacteraceae bacterium THAF1]|uniref:TIM barrel protein n=1 Tax=Palleronia sp. THAF1 TaxID=2587842 RepID=UPI000F3EE9A1|nr:TIM barrel protein [Palleronia sp. THAF1]QFU10017.1 Inosose dehydratase [Palleronia sp. THAF1]VDC17078.1 Inosose dehydratase [Rhodobacteraceae bacterium THAF1]